MDIQLYSDDWYKTKGLWYRYYVTALAECGLTLENIEREYIEKAFSELENTFDCNCGDFMLLRSLVKLGYANEPVMRHRKRRPPYRVAEM